MVETHIMVSGAIAEELPWVDPLPISQQLPKHPTQLADLPTYGHPAGRYSFIMHDPFETLTLKIHMIILSLN